MSGVSLIYPYCYFPYTIFCRLNKLYEPAQCTFHVIQRTGKNSAIFHKSAIFNFRVIITSNSVPCTLLLIMTPGLYFGKNLKKLNVVLTLK